MCFQILQFSMLDLFIFLLGTNLSVPCRKVLVTHYGIYTSEDEQINEPKTAWIVLLYL